MYSIYILIGGSIWTSSVFADNDTEIIAHEMLNETLYYDWYGQLYPSRLDGGAMMSGGLFANDSRLIRRGWSFWCAD